MTDKSFSSFFGTFPSYIEASSFRNPDDTKYKRVIKRMLMDNDFKALQ